MDDALWWYASDNGEWWLCEDKDEDGAMTYELIHRPTREKGGCGSQGIFHTYESAVDYAEEVQDGTREMIV